MLWAIGVYDLHLSSEQFWRLTPRQFWSLCERQSLSERRQDARAALVAAVIANVNRPKSKRSPYKVEDFMPRNGHKEQSPEQQAAMLQVIAAVSRRVK